MRRCFASWPARIDAWRSAGGADAALIADYGARSLTLGTRVRATLPGDGRSSGSPASVDEQGRLLIDTGGDSR